MQAGQNAIAVIRGYWRQEASGRQTYVHQGQTINLDALLEAFIAMPDVRASTYGNQLTMMVRQLRGSSTREAQAAQVQAGLATGEMRRSTPFGPERFMWTGVRDEEMLLQNPNEWIRQHTMGPQGYLPRIGINPLTATPAAIAAAIRPLFSDQSGMNFANMIVNQSAEWRNQIERARALRLDPKRMREVMSGSMWVGLTAARSQIIDALGTVSETFSGVLTPALQRFAEKLQQFSVTIDPNTGSAWASPGLLAGGAIGGLLLLRRLAPALGPLSRTLLGGGLGYLLTGGVSEALMGALLVRGMTGQRRR